MNNKELVIKVGQNKFLQEMVQDLFFKNKVLWLGTSNKYKENLPYGDDLCFTGINKYLQYSPLNFYQNNKYMVYDAATQMGEIVKLFEKKPELEIHGYKIEKIIQNQNGKEGSVKFGCATIAINLLRSVYQWTELPGTDCNRTISSIKLNSGKELTKEQIKEILDYVDNYKE